MTNTPRISKACLVILGISFALCQSATDADSSKSQGKIFVYRYKQFQGSALKPSFYLDDGELARVENGRYFAINIKPKEYTLRSNDKQSGIRLKVEPGKMYFVRVEIATGFAKGHGRVVSVPNEQGIVELQKLKPLPSSRVQNATLVSLENAPER